MCLESTEVVVGPQKLSILVWYQPAVCGDFDLILGNSFMVGHSATLDYSNFTASFCRDGKLYTVTPSSVLSDRGTAVPAHLSDVEIRHPNASGSFCQALLCACCRCCIFGILLPSCKYRSHYHRVSTAVTIKLTCLCSCAEPTC